MDDEALIEELKELQRTPIVTIKFSEDFLLSRPSSDKAKHPSSSSSAKGLSNGTDGRAPNPVQLAADLSHYKELLSKVSFSFDENMTKEEFFWANISEQPPVIENADNIALKKQLAPLRVDLEALKEDFARLKEVVEAKGKDLAERYEQVTLQTTHLTSLPSTIASLEATRSTLASTLAANSLSASNNPSLSLPLPETRSLLAQRRAELDALNKQYKNLSQTTVPRWTREAEQLKSELKPLEAQAQAKGAAAVEARRRKEAGERGIGDGLELKGRWHRAVEAGMVDILGARAVGEGDKMKGGGREETAVDG